MSDGARPAQTAPPCTLVIFGATGDLTHRLLMPALYNLSRWGLIGEGFRVVGISRSTLSSGDYRRDLTQTVEGFVKARGGEAGFDREAWDRIAGSIEYRSGDLSEPETFEGLRETIGEGGALFYLAIAADLFGPVVKSLGQGRAHTGARRRVPARDHREALRARPCRARSR